MFRVIFYVHPKSFGEGESQEMLAARYSTWFDAAQALERLLDNSVDVRDGHIEVEMKPGHWVRVDDPFLFEEAEKGGAL